MRSRVYHWIAVLLSYLGPSIGAGVESLRYRNQRGREPNQGPYGPPFVSCYRLERCRSGSLRQIMPPTPVRVSRMDTRPPTPYSELLRARLQGGPGGET